MKVLDNIKNLDKFNKFILVTTIIIIFLLAFNIIQNVNHLEKFNERQNLGNEKWKQVEQRIKEYEIKIDTLEKLLQK